MDRPPRDPPEGPTGAGPAGAGPPGVLLLDEPADLVVLAHWRRLLTGWLAETLTSRDLAAGADLNAGPDLAEDIVLAVDEAVTNAVEHAYRDRSPGPVRLWARDTGAGLTVVVGDYGCWRTPALDLGHRGRGLSVIRLLAGRLDLACTPAGTTVTMTWTASL